MRKQCVPGSLFSCPFPAIQAREPGDEVTADFNNYKTMMRWEQNWTIDWKMFGDVIFSLTNCCTKRTDCCLYFSYCLYCKVAGSNLTCRNDWKTRWRLHSVDLTSTGISSLGQNIMHSPVARVVYGWRVLVYKLIWKPGSVGYVANRAIWLLRGSLDENACFSLLCVGGEITFGYLALHRCILAVLKVCTKVDTTLENTYTVKLA